MRLKYIIVLFFLTPFIGKAQVLINKGSAIYIQEQALVKVQGDFTNDASGGINNDGTIELTGNFENKTGSTFQVYNNSASKERVVKFIGTGTQLIKGSMSGTGSSSFYNLVIDKTSGSDSVEMQIPVVVEGSLVFGAANTTTTYNPANIFTNNNQKGFIKTFGSLGEFLLDMQNGNADAIAGYPVLETAGAPATGFVITSGIRGSADGGLQRKISSATSYVFPVGTNGKGFNGARINFSTIPGGGSVKAKFCDGSSSVDGYVGTISQYCSGCGNLPPDNAGYNRYFSNNGCNSGNPQWIILDHTAQNHGYWSFASTNTGYQYDMEVFPNSFDGYVQDGSSTWRVLKHQAPYNSDPSFASIDWRPEIESLVSGINDLLTYTKNVGCYMGAGVPGGSYTDFAHFTMGMSHSDNALPVKLLYIKAEAAGKHHITVSWATALEINNAGFEVMRSTDGVNFSDVGWVNGHNNSTVNETYSFDDRVMDEGIPYYYKLKQVDNNQQFQYSNIVEVQFVPDQSAFALYPNPTSNDLFLNFTSPGEVVKITLYDMQGRAVYENIFTVAQSGTNQTLTVHMASVLPPGTYVMNATTSNAQYKEKVILQ